MIKIGQWLLVLVAVLFAAALDKNWGVPLWSLWLGLYLSRHWQLLPATGLFIITSLVLASLLFLPWWLVLLLFWASWWWLNMGQRVINSHNIRFLLIGLISWLVVGFFHDFSPAQAAYLLLSAPAFGWWLKRHRWHHEQT